MGERWNPDAIGDQYDQEKDGWQEFEQNGKRQDSERFILKPICIVYFCGLPFFLRYLHVTTAGGHSEHQGW